MNKQLLQLLIVAIPFLIVGSAIAYFAWKRLNESEVSKPKKPVRFHHDPKRIAYQPPNYLNSEVDESWGIIENNMHHL